jgi:ACS family hexuronate transporter-like MFS transporter
VSLLTSRKLVMTTGTVLMAGPACIGLADTAFAAILLFCVGGFAHQMLSGALLTLSADLFEPHEVATASGMAGSAAWIGGLSFSLLIGALAETVGYDPLFVCMALLDVVGATILWTLLQETRATT